MLKSIAAGAALICATLAWFIFATMLGMSGRPPVSPETAANVTVLMLFLGLGLLVISPFVGLFNWARGK